MRKSTKPVDVNLVYSAPDVAEHFGASRSTIYEWINSHGLGAYGRHITGKWLFSGKNIERWVLGLPPIKTEDDLRQN